MSNFVNILWDALKAGETGNVMALLEGLDVKNIADSKNRTLLHLSALYGNILITKHIIGCGCIIDAEDDCEITPLILAIYFRHLEVIEILINAGADLCRIQSNGRSPIFYATLDRDPKISKIIKLAIKNKKAVKSKIMQLSLDTTFYKRGFMCLFRRTGQVDYRPLFASGYCDIDQCSPETVPLIKAIFLGDMHQLKMNINYQVSPNIQDGNGWTALHAVATMSTARLASSESYTKLSNSDVYYKLSQILQILFDHGADVNTKDNKGATPLHIAAGFGHHKICKWLLQHGADVNARDNAGLTPLHAAFMPCRLAKETKEILLQNGADVFAISSAGQTILELTENSVDYLWMRNFILKNLAILKSLGTPANDKYLELLRQNLEMQSFYEKCELELQHAKDNKIMNTITFFDFLTKSTRVLAVYVKNKDLHTLIKSFEWRNKYPIFAKRIQRRFEEATNRLDMTNNASVILSTVMPYSDPEHPVIEHVLSYFTHKDLQTLTNCIEDDCLDR